MPSQGSGSSRSVAAMRPLHLCPSGNPDRATGLCPSSSRHPKLQRLLDRGKIEASLPGAKQLTTDTFRILLLLLYGAGLRFSEATGLTMADVDLSDAILRRR